MKRKFVWYGWVGILGMMTAEILMFMNFSPVSSFFTPIAWTFYILCTDALNYKLSGRSLIMSKFKEFLFMLPLSAFSWFVFEFYNLFLRNWHYINLPQNLALRWFGYIWSFSTIFPGIFETTELIKNLHIGNITTKTYQIKTSFINTLILLGIIFLISPLILPGKIPQYLAGPVWCGFVLFLDPINYKAKRPSLLRSIEAGQWGRIVRLLASGTVCGLLWEFWNFWAYTKWEYTLPFYAGPRIFEMPLLGFLGFLPFAIECYCMYVFFVSFFPQFKDTEWADGL